MTLWIFFDKRLNKVPDNFFKQNKTETMLLLYDITSVFFEVNGPKDLYFCCR